MTILLIENHEDTVTYLRRFLKQLGHEVVVAADAMSATNAVNARRFDLILSDIRLSGGDGWTLMEQIRGKTQAYAIAMSGLGSADDIVRSHSVGYQDHLIKPFTPDKLREMLKKAELVGTRGAGRNLQSRSGNSEII